MPHDRFEYEMPARSSSRTSPRVAAAHMVGRSFPFSRWAGPRALRWLLEPVTKVVFDWQTNKRFGRMRAFLQEHAADVAAWQRAERRG